MARSYVSFPQLVDIIGIADAMALCKQHGGCAVYIAKRPEKCALVGIISGCGVESLCAELGGEEYMLPLGPFRKVPIKEAIVAMLEAGLSHTEVARECGCTTRYSAMVAQNTGIKATPHKKPQKASTDEVVNA